MAKFKFENTYCSQCGREFGPGDHGYSHCANHRHLDRKPYPLFEKGTAVYPLEFECGAIAYVGPSADGEAEARRLDAMCIVLGTDLLMLDDFTNDAGESVTDVLLDKYHAIIKGKVDAEIEIEKNFHEEINMP